MPFECYTEEETDSYGRSTLVIKDDKSERKYLDGGEPEDNYFFRDWHWVESEIDKAYQQGLIDGRKEAV